VFRDRGRGDINININICSIELKKEWRDEQPDVDEMEDCSKKQEQNDRKIYLLF